MNLDPARVMTRCIVVYLLSRFESDAHFMSVVEQNEAFAIEVLDRMNRVSISRTARGRRSGGLFGEGV